MNVSDIQQITLKNACLEARVLTLGASLQDLRFGEVSVVVGSSQIADYLGPQKYFGAIVGRVANRIAGARCELGGKVFRLDANENGQTCLHGGSEGAGKLIWDVHEQGRAHVVLGLVLEDGHMGFSGALEVQARYELRESALRLEISAQSDAETLCSFAPHGYWNLGGEMDAHRLKVAAERYLPVDPFGIPTGAQTLVAGTEFDFRDWQQIEGRALDHNFCLSTARTDLRPVLWLEGQHAKLEVATTEPGVQLYDARHAGRCGLAIEPQVWPDAINQKGFPEMRLQAGERYLAITEFRLS